MLATTACQSPSNSTALSKSESAMTSKGETESSSKEATKGTHIIKVSRQLQGQKAL